MGSKKKKISLSNPDDIKDIPNNPDLVREPHRKLLYGEFKKRCKTNLRNFPNLQSVTQVGYPFH